MRKCVFCGRDIDEKAVACPHCQKSLDAASVAGKAAADGVKEVLSPVSKKVDELADQVKGINDRVAKIEAAPAGAAAPAVSTRSKNFMGYSLHKQGRFIHDQVAKNPQRFDLFKSAEKVEEFSKYIIALVHAMKFQKDEAKQFLAEWQKTSMDSHTDANGAYLVPTVYASEMIQLARERTFAYNDCTVIPMSTDSMLVPKELTLASLAWKTKAAGQQMSGTEPTFAQVSLDALPLTGMAVVTNALLQDSVIDISSMLAEMFSYGTLLELDNQVLNGTGSPVSGITTAAAGYSVVTAGISFSSITAANLSLAISKVKAGYRESAKFYVGGALQSHYLRDLKDTANRPIFTDVWAQSPATIYGYPRVETEQLGGTDGSGKIGVVFANLKRAVFIGERVGAMTLELDPYGRFDYNETRFRMVTRWAISQANNAAECRIVNG